MVLSTSVYQSHRSCKKYRYSLDYHYIGLSNQHIYILCGLYDDLFSKNNNCFIT